MNGVLVGSGVVTQYGVVQLGHPELTDVWGTLEQIQTLVNAEESFYREDGDRISAHIQTSRGRLFLHNRHNDPWQPPTKSRKDALWCLDKLADLLDVRALYYSPTARGISMLDFTRGKHKDWFSRELPPDWDKVDTAVTPNFTRRIDRACIGWNLHKFDTRAAWLASARTAPCGFNQWRRIAHFDPRAAAIWPVKLNKGRADPGPIVFSGWYDTAIVRAAMAMGQDITIMPGQGWTGQTTALRPFCERLVRARSGVDGATPARWDRRDWLIGAIKAVYTRTFGSLNSHRKAQPWTYQPHWYYSLRAESARRMWAAYDSLPHYTIGLDTDSLYCVAPPDVSPFAIVPSATTDAFNPGKWLYEGFCPLSRALYDVLGGKGSDLRKELDARNALQPWEA